MTHEAAPTGDHDYGEAPDNAIAIVGWAAHLPGATTIDDFWTNLEAGVECIRRFTDQELEAAGVDQALLSNPHYVKANGILDDMEGFDAGFFGLSPRDAAVMDPQTRHFLECAWHALESAGHAPRRFDGAIGVFAGAGAGQYFWKNVVQDPELMESVGYFLLRHTGNDKDFVATRASYEFDLTGPSMSVQTACSTSLVAIHLACQSLLSWECDMALAGGVTIEQPHITGYLYEDGEILSPDGHCRSFDASSKGTVFGSGAGVIALRRLADARESGDVIHAVIRGSAVNNDGAGKVSYLAPSVDGQAKVIAEALAVADVSADSIGMVEAHGTGTPIGDPIEVTALTQAFRTQTDRVGYCALGSVKSNIGHLDTAAGVASIIKACLAVKHGVIPPTIHFESPNPLLDLDTSPFFVNSTALPWPDGTSPRRAGVSSLGVGGTNAHIIVEEAPRPRPTSESRPWQLLTLSARSNTALEDATGHLVEHLETHPAAALPDIAHTLHAGRERFSHRRTLVCRSTDEAIESLASGQAVGLTNAKSDAEGRDVAFLFAGGGAQYPNMGRELYENEPIYREIVDDCLAHLRAAENIDLAPFLFCDEDKVEQAANELQRPSLALPALFTVQFAQARLWMSWGVEPSAMIGHSMGEYTAACIAGVFSTHEALSLVTLRGRLFETLDEGGMLSVSLGEAELRARLSSELSIAALNAPEVSVASGPVSAIDALEAQLKAEDIDCRRIRIDVAAHSSMLQPILAEFGEKLKAMSFSAPTMTVISNLSGEVAGKEISTAEYWVKHLRHTVRFSDGIGQLLRPDGPVLVEVGPGRTLATVAKMHPDWTQDQPSLNSLPHPSEPSDAQAFQLGALGALWVHGVDPDWGAFNGTEIRNRTSIPGYPFERQPHFVPPPTRTATTITTTGDASVRIDDPAGWFQVTEWAPSMPPAKTEVSPLTAMVLADAGSAGERIGNRLTQEGHAVLSVRRGSQFSLAGNEATVRVGSSEDWKALFADLSKKGAMPGLIVHSWCLGPVDSAGDGEDEAFYGPLALLQALESTTPGHPCRLVAVTSGAVPAPGGPSTAPSRALLTGPIRVAPKELPSLKTRLVDVDWSEGVTGAREANMLDRVVQEITAPADQVVVAFRGADRLAERFAPFPLPEADSIDAVRDGGVYLVTGGLGGIGLELARDLAEMARVKLVLVSRSGLPAEGERDAWLEANDDNDKTSRGIRELRALEATGAEVLVVAADVTDGQAMRAVVSDAVARFGALDGVLHAAGILDDGPLLARESDQARAVLAAKVAGTQALGAAVADHELDFFILFSSVSAVIGAPGQVDYAAANAFMDAYARQQSEETGRRVLALAWGAWKDVGMAAELAGEAKYDRSADEGAAPVTTFEHPLFDAAMSLADGQRAFRVEYTRDKHWMLEEHQVRDGAWVLPGSGYVELIRAAAHEIQADTAFAMRDLVFLSPFQLSADESRELELAFTPESSDWNVTVRGRSSANDEWTEHANAVVAMSSAGANGSEALGDVVDRLGTPTAEARPPHPVMAFGPRWANITGQSTGTQEAVLSHALPTEFLEDLTSVALHPAILDMATGGAQHLIPGVDPAVDFLVPAGYGNLVMLGPLGEEAVSHVRLKNSDDTGTFASFDVTIYNPSGEPAVIVDDFSMIRVSKDALEAPGAAQPSWLRDALAPSEGREAFRRVLAGAPGSHVFVATRPLGALVAEAAAAPVRSHSSSARRAPDRVLMTEVAETLGEYDPVAEATALGTPSASDSARVVGFIVYEPGRHATVSELRRFARKRLPKEQVPQNFVEMAALPRDPDGSVRIGDLRDPFATADTYVAPRTPTEETVAAIWADLLALDRVGIHDNFLDVGGHSLVGIRVLLRIQQETGVRIEANALTMQTLEQLAADIDRESS